jgi:hypothetical protein
VCPRLACTRRVNAVKEVNEPQTRSAVVFVNAPTGG